MKTIKAIIISFLFIFTLAFAQQAQAQVTKEYVTVSILGPVYAISYPDGKIEEGKIEQTNVGKNIVPNAKTTNDIFNMLGKKGYKLVSSVGDVHYAKYIFENRTE